MFSVKPFSPDTKIIVTDGEPEITPELDRQIQSIWDAEQRRKKGVLFNGRRFSVSRIGGKRIEGFFVDYRLVIAQRIRPDLFGRLGVRPLAVSGLLSCRDGLVFGRRSAMMTQDANRWELAGSGGIDPFAATDDGGIDLTRQLFDEIREETGIDGGHLYNPIPFCMIEDPDSHVIDIAIALSTALNGAAVVKKFLENDKEEYVALEIVDCSEIPNFLKTHQGNVSEVSMILLRERGMLEGSGL